MKYPLSARLGSELAAFSPPDKTLRAPLPGPRSHYFTCGALPKYTAVSTVSYLSLKGR